VRVVGDGLEQRSGLVRPAALGQRLRGLPPDAHDLRRIGRRQPPGLQVVLGRVSGRAAPGARQIGACRKDGEALSPSVKLTADHNDPLFSSLNGEGNALKVWTADGRVWRCRGRGAGRWATTESIMADLAEIVRARRADAGLN
jgi:hypothetical protein